MALFLHSSFAPELLQLTNCYCCEVFIYFILFLSVLRFFASTRQSCHRSSEQDATLGILSRRGDWRVTTAFLLLFPGRLIADRPERPPAPFIFGLAPQNIFFLRAPLELLNNGDYASSYSRNVSIPPPRQNSNVPCEGMYASDPE